VDVNRKGGHEDRRRTGGCGLRRLHEGKNGGGRGQAEDKLDSEGRILVRLNRQESKW